MAPYQSQGAVRSPGEAFFDHFKKIGFKRAFLYPLLLLLPTIFAFIAIILINVGGSYVDAFPDRTWHGYDGPREGNQAYALLKWEWDVVASNLTGLVSQYTSMNLGRTESYSVYLHRICLTIRDTESVSTARCQLFDLTQNNLEPATFGGTIGQSLGKLTSLSARLSVPYAFYILAAIFIMLLWLIHAVHKHWRRNWTGWAALGVSCSSLVCLLIASAIVTAQMVDLVRQIERNIPTIFNITFQDSWQFYELSDTYFVTGKQTYIQRTAIALTWAAVAAAGLDVAKWIYRNTRHEDDYFVTKVEKETAVQG